MVYFYAGEGFQRGAAVEALRAEVLPEGLSEFNYERMSAKGLTMQAVLASARTVPMFAKRRLVEVQDADAFSADQLNALLPYLENPSPSCVLLFSAGKVNTRIKFFGALKKGGGTFKKFEPIKERNAPRWLADRARERGLKLAPGVADSIVAAVGASLGELHQALTKLDLYAGKGNAITIDDVDTLLASTRQRSVFELTNAIGRGQRREAMLTVKRMVDRGESGVGLVTMLARHLRQMWGVKEMTAARKSERDIASKLGIHPFFVRDIAQQARRFDREQLARMHRLLFAADRALKSSPVANRSVLDQLVVSLTRR